MHRNIIPPMREVKNARGPQGQPVENPWPTLLDGQILVLAAQDIWLIEETQWLEVSAMLLVELMPLSCNLLVEFFAKFRVLGLLGVVRANIHRVFPTLAMVVEVAAKISGDEQLAM